MSARTGLAAETCTCELAQEMAAIPALAKAFKGSYANWTPLLTMTRLGLRPMEPKVYELGGGPEGNSLVNEGSVSAPTCRAMLLFLNRRGRLSMDTDKAADPDALARACCEAAK